MTLQNISLRSFAVCAVAIGAAACQPSPSPQQARGPDTVAATAPDSFLVALQTSKGRVVVQAIRSWSPRGVDRFHELVNDRFYDGVRFFRVLPSYIVQFGINGDPSMNDQWRESRIPDDPVTQTNARGTLTFATGGPNTRTTQLFINKRDNRRLDGMGFAPIGKVIEGMDVVDRLYSGYGEGAPDGAGPLQDRIEHEGNKYLSHYFPLLDSVVTARVVRIKPE